MINSYDEAYHNRPYVNRTPREDVVKFLESLKKHNMSRVLDLGCGDGRHTIYLAQQGFVAVGVDNAMWGVRRTQEWAKQETLSPQLACSEVRCLPLQSNWFDAAMSIQVIHHQRFSAIRETLTDIKRILRPGGFLYLSLPQYPPGDWQDYKYVEIEEHTYAPLEGLEKDLPHHLFTKEELESTLHEFEILEIDSSTNLKVLVRKKD